MIRGCMTSIPTVISLRDFPSIIQGRKFQRIWLYKKRTRQLVSLEGNLGAPMGKDRNYTMGGGGSEGGGFENKFQRHIRPIEIIQPKERRSGKNRRRLGRSDAGTVISLDSKIEEKGANDGTVIAAKNRELPRRDFRRNSLPDFTKRFQRSLDQRGAATDGPTMGIALPELVRRNVRLAKIRGDRMDNAFRIGSDPSQLAKHAFAAHQTSAGELRERSGDPLLQRLQPKRTRPGRTRSVELVENGQEAAAAILPELPHPRHQSKRNPARLIAVVHVMQNNVIEFRSR